MLLPLSPKNGDEQPYISRGCSEYTGGGMYIAPDAKKFRDKLNLLFAKKLSRLQAVKLLIMVFSEGIYSIMQ